MFPSSLRPHGSLLFREGLAALLPGARLMRHLNEANGGGILLEGARGGCLAGPTPSPSPWQHMGSGRALGVSHAPTTSSKGGPGFSWWVGSHLLRGVSSPDMPCPKPGDDWGHLGKRKWRQKFSKTQPSLGAGRGRAVGRPSLAKSRVLQASWLLLCVDLLGSHPLKVNSMRLSLEGL